MTESSRSGSSLVWGPSDRLAVCYGTRPQVIKASVLTETLSRRWPLLTIDTGQHFDDQLQRVFYTQLGVPEPQYCLDVRAADPAQQVADILTRASQIFARERPWAVVVLGDTNSTLGCAMAAAQMRIPLVHVEAGLRVGDPLMIEEINRRVVDSIGALLCAPSVAAAERLRSERVAGTVVHTGDVARDVLERFSARAAPVASFEWWPVSHTEPFVFATLHRAELMNDLSVLRGVLTGLGELGLPVVLPAHPRLRTALASSAIGSLPPTIQVLNPLGYLEALACTREALAVVTDSGGIQREAYWLGTPCITVRDETEWTETVELGANVVVSPRSAALWLPRALDQQVQTSTARRIWDRNAYGAGDAAGRIGDAIQTLAIRR
ncbi:MAG TPA: UDP-N-acetyl glucosamine 2-epimerase [Gemmatimonadaceae bacterium]|nr:UDP-N-acetyl glucosamine 2-epimerase [Gemmatimonadaceae bacterium]